MFVCYFFELYMCIVTYYSYNVFLYMTTVNPLVLAGNKYYYYYIMLLYHKTITKWLDPVFPERRMSHEV